MIEGLLADPVAAALLLGQVTGQEAVEEWERDGKRLREGGDRRRGWGHGEAAAGVG